MELIQSGILLHRQTSKELQLALQTLNGVGVMVHLASLEA
jgi:hypothetical protein